MPDCAAATLPGDLQGRADAGVPLAALVPRDFAEAVRLAGDRPPVEAFDGIVWVEREGMFDTAREIAAEIEVEFVENVKGDAWESEAEAAAPEQTEDAVDALVNQGTPRSRKMTAKMATDP
jgi:hypothetical protein